MAFIVVLNGTSSSGKTSIARAFQELALPRIFLNFSAIAPHEVLLVGLDCPVDVLVERERQRGRASACTSGWSTTCGSTRGGGGFLGVRWP